MDRPVALIEILLDAGAAEADRDDAAMDLSAHDEPEAAAALLEAGSNPLTPPTVAASAGESLAEIWLRRGKFDAASFDKLTGEARQEAAALIGARRADWLRLATR